MKTRGAGREDVLRFRRSSAEANTIDPAEVLSWTDKHKSNHDMDERATSWLAANRRAARFKATSIRARSEDDTSEILAAPAEDTSGRDQKHQET